MVAHQDTLRRFRGWSWGSWVGCREPNGQISCLKCYKIVVTPEFQKKSGDIKKSVGTPTLKIHPNLEVILNHSLLHRPSEAGRLDHGWERVGNPAGWLIEHMTISFQCGKTSIFSQCCPSTRLEIHIWAEDIHLLELFSGCAQLTSTYRHRLNVSFHGNSSAPAIWTWGSNGLKSSTPQSVGSKPAPVLEAAVLHCPGSGLIGKAEGKTTIFFPPQGSCGHYETPFDYAGGASFGEDSPAAGLLN